MLIVVGPAESDTSIESLSLGSVVLAAATTDSSALSSVKLLLAFAVVLGMEKLAPVFPKNELPHDFAPIWNQSRGLRSWGVANTV